MYHILYIVTWDDLPTGEQGKSWQIPSSSFKKGKYVIVVAIAYVKK